MANIGGNSMNPGIKMFSLPSANGLLGRKIIRSGQVLVLRMGNYP
jgi:hypothetical protein